MSKGTGDSQSKRSLRTKERITKYQKVNGKERRLSK
jgi:hypothetical protein